MEMGKGAGDNLGTGMKNDSIGNKLKQNVVFNPVVSCYFGSFEQPTSSRLKNTTNGEPEGYADNDLGVNQQHDEVQERFKNTLYGYFLGKKVAFSVVERKWNPSSKLSKEELTFVPVWIKFHGVLRSAFTIDGLSAIAIRLGSPVIDLCTVTTCVQSWGRMDYVRALVDIRADRALKDTMKDNGTPMDDLVDGTKKKVGAPSRKTGIWSGGDDDPNEEDGSDKTTHSSKLLEISWKAEDGLLIVVSPLLRIHNKTDIHFQWPENQGNDHASVVLKVGWSDELKGGKAARLSGLFNKIKWEVNDMHFLIHSIRRDVPIFQSERRGSSVALLEQKEIYILPTVQISNLLQSEIHVLLTDKDHYFTQDGEDISKQATISCRSSVNLYANPEEMFFTVTLIAFGVGCKPLKHKLHDGAKVVEKHTTLYSALSQLASDFDGENMMLLQRFFHARVKHVVSTGSLKLDLALGIEGLPKFLLISLLESKDYQRYPLPEQLSYKKIGLGQPKWIEKANILVANTAMDTDKVKVYGARVRVDSMSKIAKIDGAEKDKMREKVQKIIGHGINCFFNRQLIYNFPEELFADAGILAIEHADFDESVKLGHCKLIEEIMIGEDKLIHFSGGLYYCIAGSKSQRPGLNRPFHVLDEAERSLHDALCVVSQIVNDSRVLLGGGWPEMIMAKAVDDAELIAQLEAEHHKENSNAGIDVITGSVGDMSELGISESFKVKQGVLLSATEATATEMILRVDEIITCAPRTREDKM
ncbi:T-complex protein 1 subunit beta [Tanacetum coccineum]